MVNASSATGITVLLGTNVRTSAQVSHRVTRASIIEHRNYNRQTLVNDIALIRIPHTAYTTLIQPIRLPAIARTYPTFAGENAVVAGWGQTTDRHQIMPTNLQWARMPVMTPAACQRIWQHMVTASNICVSTTNRVATCFGDSGGPLVSEASNVQIGVVSFGAATGCELGYPSVFARVTSFLEWIRTNTGISY